ncbi:hypothetical protein DFJ63DRAFT_336032 [Scheffersomyces coipomensis]|uniref:uncharacterized protein n=1 Tax=Scheffersomyces coipomensis TaxID=1788519 RepID=UPI00315DD2B1
MSRLRNDETDSVMIPMLSQTDDDDNREKVSNSSNERNKKCMKLMIWGHILFVLTVLFVLLILSIRKDSRNIHDSSGSSVISQPLSNDVVNYSSFIKDIEKGASLEIIFTISGITMFASLTYGVIFGPIGAALLPLIGTAGNYIVASFFASATTGLVLYGGVNLWEWYDSSLWEELRKRMYDY